MNSSGLRAMVLLIVDDNVDAADSLAIALELGGDVVAKAYDGRSAVLLVERMTPDIVISDLEMPGMSGLDEAVAVRRLSLRQQPWMIAITGATQRGVESAAFDAGYDFFLTKPTDLPHLTGVIDQLRQRPARSAARRIRHTPDTP